jgi:AcrR family transcriptional regulator
MASEIKKMHERASYRHGDLRRVLLESGVALAQMGGPEAVVLREATRQAGVVPNAAYRHFENRDGLLKAVRAHALSLLANKMEAELAKLSSTLSAEDLARASVRAVGTGYLKFAQAEPGLFRTAFSTNEGPEADADPAKAGRSELNPFQLLSGALDLLVESNVIPVERRPGAEYLAWAAVHGLAVLFSNGPLQSASPEIQATIGQRVLDMVEKGL